MPRSRAHSQLSTILEFGKFMRARKKLWLAPIVIALGLIHILFG